MIKESDRGGGNEEDEGGRWFGHGAGRGEKEADMQIVS